MGSESTPTAIALTRQNLQQLEGSSLAPSASSTSEPEAMIIKSILSLFLASAITYAPFIASGSEVELALGAKEELEKDGKSVRVVSVPCMDIFEGQDVDYKESVLPPSVRARLEVEAGATMPWYKYVGIDGAVVGMEGFGASAPAKTLFEHFGFTVNNVVEVAKGLIK